MALQFPINNRDISLLLASFTYSFFQSKNTVHVSSVKKKIFKSVFYVVIFTYKTPTDYSFIISVNIYFIHEIYSHTSTYLCNFKYWVVCILHIFRLYDMSYILEDRKPATLSACLEREGGQSIGKITVVQVFCHLQLKSVLIITEAQPLIELRHWQKGRASIPWKRNGASSPSVPLGHIPWSKSLRSSLICNISRLSRCHICLVECQKRRDDLPFTWCSLSCNSKCLKRGLGIEGILKEINRNRPWVVLREGQTVQLTQSHESSCTMTGGFRTRCPKRGYLSILNMSSCATKIL